MVYPDFTDHFYEIPPEFEVVVVNPVIAMRVEL